MPINKIGRYMKGRRGLERIFGRNFLFRNMPSGTRQDALKTLKGLRSGGGISRRELRRKAYGKWVRNTRDRVSRSQARTIRRELGKYLKKRITDPHHPPSSPAYFRTGHDQYDHPLQPDQANLPPPGPLPSLDSLTAPASPPVPGPLPSPGPSPAPPPSGNEDYIPTNPTLPPPPGNMPDLTKPFTPPPPTDALLDEPVYSEPVEPDLPKPPSQPAPPPSFDNPDQDRDIFGRPRL